VTVENVRMALRQTGALALVHGHVEQKFVAVHAQVFPLVCADGALRIRLVAPEQRAVGRRAVA
jgi:hypothetical protein